MTPFACIMLIIFGVWAVICLMVVAFIGYAICSCWFEED